MEKLKAFMSYTRFDDENDGKRLTLLRKRLSDEVRAQTGKKFPIFQDIEDIGWGQDFKERIENAIKDATFLIPIITPSFFESEYCREELEQFLKREEQLQRNDLILAVYYIRCQIVEDPSKRATDKLAQTIAARQYVDWRDLRFEDFNSPEVRSKLVDMARQIHAAMERQAEVPTDEEPPPEAMAMPEEGPERVQREERFQSAVEMSRTLEEAAFPPTPKPLPSKSLFSRVWQILLETPHWKMYAGCLAVIVLFIVAGALATPFTDALAHQYLGWLRSPTPIHTRAPTDTSTLTETVVSPTSTPLPPMPTDTPTPTHTPTTPPTDTPTSTHTPTIPPTDTPTPTQTPVPPTATANYTPRPPALTPTPAAPPPSTGPITLTIYLRDTLAETGVTALSGDQVDGGEVYKESQTVYGDVAVQIGDAVYHFDKPEIGPGEPEQLPAPWRVEFEFSDELITHTGGMEPGFDPKKAGFWVGALDGSSAVGEDNPYSLTMRLYEGDELRKSIQVFFTVADVPGGGGGSSGRDGKSTPSLP